MTRGGVAVGVMARRRPCKALLRAPPPAISPPPLYMYHLPDPRSDMRAVAPSLNPTSSRPEILTPPVPRLIVPDRAAVTRLPADHCECREA